jgi:hypothetical protein
MGSPPSPGSRPWFDGSGDEPALSHEAAPAADPDARVRSAVERSLTPCSGKKMPARVSAESNEPRHNYVWAGRSASVPQRGSGPYAAACSSLGGTARNEPGGPPPHVSLPPRASAGPGGRCGRAGRAPRRPPGGSSKARACAPPSARRRGARSRPAASSRGCRRSMGGRSVSLMHRM